MDSGTAMVKWGSLFRIYGSGNSGEMEAEIDIKPSEISTFNPLN